MALLRCLSDVAQVERHGAAPLPPAARDAALLAWLALEGSTSRDRLAALLWPTSSQAQGRTALHQRLFQLKKALDADVAGGSPLVALAECVAHDLDEVVELLDDAALAELVDELRLGIEGRAIAPQLLQRTGRNPLFVLETLKQAWVDQRIDDLAQGGSLPRPLSVGQLVEPCVAQLSPPALALARVASIAGVDFSLDLAEQVLGTSAMYRANALNELKSAQVLKGLQFAHDLVFDAVLASVPTAIAQHTHARTASFLAQRQAEPAHIAELGWRRGDHRRLCPG